MLIINADDWGRSEAATDRAAICYRSGRITSTSAMVFMRDSVRGACIAQQLGIDVGLHINYTEDFTAPSVPPEVREAHNSVRSFLKSSKFSLLLYHPLLRRQFSLVFRAQAEEFVRLYGRAPSHFDGHQHMHLCSNNLLDRLMPAGTKARRSFSFSAGEKGIVNRGYRSLVDRHLAKCHRLTDYFFALSQDLPAARMKRVTTLACEKTVELMTHPEVTAEFDYLMSDEFGQVIAQVPLGTYSSL